MQTRSSFGIAAAVVVMCMLGFVTSASAQGVGGIGGTVADQSGAVLPGVTVTLSNPLGSLGGNQTTVTDERGAFQFVRLVPGTYTVRADLSGFRPATQEGIVVNADVTARADMRLQIGALEEGIIVSGQSPLLDTTSAHAADRHFARSAQRAAEPRRRLERRARHPERHSQQGRRRRIGVVSAVVRHGPRQQQRERIPDRRDGRFRTRRQWHGGSHVSRSVCVRGNQLPGRRRRQRGRTEGRPALQHGDPDRHQQVPRRRNVQRRRSQHGLREPLQRHEGADSGRRAINGSRREPKHRAWRRHPEDLRHWRMAGRSHRAGQALVLVLVPRSGAQPVPARAATTRMGRRCSTTTRCGQWGRKSPGR